MKVILGARGSGKTTKLIEESNKTGSRIIVRSADERKRICFQAHHLNIDIPDPITYRGFIDGDYRGEKNTNFLLDDLDSFLSYLCPKGSIETVALTPTGLKILTLPENCVNEYQAYLSRMSMQEYRKLVEGSWETEE